MHLDAIFPIVIFVIVTLSKLLSASKQPPPPSGPSGPGAPRRNLPSGESEQERYRKFMEAVGLPKDSPPPAPVRPRTVTPGPLLPVKPPLLSPNVTPGRVRRVPPARPPAPAAPRPQTVTRQAAPAPAPAKSVSEPAMPMQQVGPLPQGSSALRPPAATAGAVARRSYPAGALLLKLRDPAAIREAIVLREVLGPPKALQPGWPMASVTTLI